MANAVLSRRMQMLWSNARVFRNHLASYDVAHSTMKEIFPLGDRLSTSKLNLSICKKGAIFTRNYSVPCLTKYQFLVMESKLHQRELQLPNHAIFHPGIGKIFPSLSSLSTHESPEPLSDLEQPPRIKFKRLDKTAKHIMNILDKEAIQEVKAERDIPDIKPGYIVQMKVEVPENKRRVSLLKGIVIARRNAGLNTTFRLRRLVAGVGVESVFPLYSPNIKEVKVLDKKKVRRAKLYYLRDRMNPLKK